MSKSGTDLSCAACGTEPNGWMYTLTHTGQFSCSGTVCSFALFVAKPHISCAYSCADSERFSVTVSHIS
jgi:hypothetical protein